MNSLFEGKTDVEVTEALKNIKREQGWIEPVEIKPEYIESELTLRDRFIEPPFSVLNTQTGSWRKRKDKWLALGIKSEVGRDVTVLIGKNDGTNDYMPDMSSETSIFDPALCELMYTWFCPKGGTILDPFAGGSVRGIVAQTMGYKYTGIELRPEQVDSNREQATQLVPTDNQPLWICGDSEKELDNLKEPVYDMVFSCPPYTNLEVYSQMEDDLSNMSYKAFLEKYFSIIKKSFTKLAPGGYAVFVVGDVRDDRGYYLDFVGDTKKIFMDMRIGAKLYNDIILLDPIGTAMIRARLTFSTGKVVKVHQNVLVFKKLGGR